MVRDGCRPTPTRLGFSEAAGLDQRAANPTPTVDTTESSPPDATEAATGSDRPVQVTVPDVVGLRVEQAARGLRAIGLRSVTHLVVSSETEGTVIDQDPEAGEGVDGKSVVDLRVARKEDATPVPTTIRLPRLVGSTAAAAKHRLRELGLHWSLAEVASDKPEGTVIGQTPTAGAEVRKGTIVTLRVSSGAVSLAVPDVTGLDEESARRELQDAGFAVTVLDGQTDDPAEDGMVVAQEPTGSTNTEKGSTVTITVARFA